MKSWIEDSAVVDISGNVFKRTGGGVAGGGEPGDGLEVARGWSKVGGSGKAVVGANLPQRIYVRWQSTVEPRTYHGWVDIPEEARRMMLESTSQRCTETPQLEPPYQATVSLGLAPGGTIQVWVWDQCHRPIKVARAQAEVEPLGPHLGKSGGNYYPQSEASKRYIERYGIPYGSW